MIGNKLLRLAAALAAATVFGCVKGEQANQSADSTARNLTLAPTESTAAMKDVPARNTEPVKHASAKKAPAKPAAPTTLTAAAGTRVAVTVKLAAPLTVKRG